jgi:hypothetical protein
MPTRPPLQPQRRRPVLPGRTVTAPTTPSRSRALYGQGETTTAPGARALRMNQLSQGTPMARPIPARRPPVPVRPPASVVSARPKPKPIRRRPGPK